jgi:uncharacterized sulfatase
LNLNPDREFNCHISARDPNHQLIYVTPWWESWVTAAKINDAAKRRVEQFHHRPQHELYDLTKDPFETNNLADRPENAVLLKSLQQKLADWRKQQGDTVPVFRNDKYVPPARPGKRAPAPEKGRSK